MHCDADGKHPIDKPSNHFNVVVCDMVASGLGVRELAVLAVSVRFFPWCSAPVRSVR